MNFMIRHSEAYFSFVFFSTNTKIMKIRIKEFQIVGIYSRRKI